MAKSTDKRTDNLKPPWKKGQSGNPKGMKKGQRNYATIYREALIKIAETQDITPEQVEEKINEVGLLKAMKGDYSFYKDVQDRLHGRSLEKSEVKLELPKPLLDVIRNNNSDEETVRPEEED